MEHLDKATAAANWFEAFIRHASVMSILLALVGSWCATAAFKMPIRALIAPAWQGWTIRMFDVVVALAICAATWPNDWRFVWAFVIGFASPIAYFLLAALACWKFPRPQALPIATRARERRHQRTFRRVSMNPFNRRTYLGHLLIAFGLLLIACAAHAQTAGAVVVTANPAVGVSPVTTVLNWTSVPNATGCAISGGVNVTGLGGSGTRTVNGITAKTDYTVTCSWAGGTASKVVNFTTPATNTDGTPLTDLASFKVLWGASASTLTNSKSVPSPASSYTVTGLGNGTWFFASRAVNAAGVESDNSNVVSAVVSVPVVTSSKTVTVDVQTKPGAPQTTVTDPIAYNVVPNLQRFVFEHGSRAGTIRIGAACDEARVTSDGYTAISRPSQVIPRPAAGTVLVAKCATI
jgi:hypothetical protein